jgi:hypothetical protein
MSRDSSVGIATDWTVRVRFPTFLYSTAFRAALRSIQPPIQWVPGAISPGVKRPGCATDHSPPSSVEVKNGGELHLHPYMSACRGA